MQKICGHCSRSFSCKQETGCWCGSVKLDAAQLAWIKQTYDNCLCPSCLTAVATGTLSDPKAK
jgi:hypothetical protein